MKQIALAANLYMSDHDGYLTGIYGGLQECYQASYVAQLSSYLGGPDFGNVMSSVEYRQDVNIPKSFFCPSQPVDSSKPLGRFTYGITGARANQGYTRQLLKRRQVPDSVGVYYSQRGKFQDLILLGDSFSQGNHFANNLIYFTEDPDYGSIHTRHSGRANHDWLDIHPSKINTSRTLLYPGSVSDAAFDRMCDYVIATYFHHPAYWKLDGCPYFSIYDLRR